MICLIKMKNGLNLVSEYLDETLPGKHLLRKPYFIVESQSENNQVSWVLIPAMALTKNQEVTVSDENLLFQPVEVADEIKNYYCQVSQLGDQNEIPKMLRSIQYAANELMTHNTLNKLKLDFFEAESMSEMAQNVMDIDLINMIPASNSIN